MTHGHSRLYSLTPQGKRGHWGLLKAYLENLSHLKDEGIHQELLSSMVKKFVTLEQRVNELLHNTLPPLVAEEIKYQGAFSPRAYDCTILFSDVAGFTKLAETLSSDALVSIIDGIFRLFDQVVRCHHGTKIKTIGDSYMAVFGAPLPDPNHASQAVCAAMQLQESMTAFNRNHFGDDETRYFQCRVGIHSGQVTAGVVGQDRMQFDVFGDTVNIASRFESSGEVGRVNISEETQRRLPPGFACGDRGEISLRNRGMMKAYFVEQLPEAEEKSGTGPSL